MQKYIFFSFDGVYSMIFVTFAAVEFGDDDKQVDTKKT